MSNGAIFRSFFEGPEKGKYITPFCDNHFACFELCCWLVLLVQALALALGYSEFASQRGGIHCNLLVLDEVLQVRAS